MRSRFLYPYLVIIAIGLFATVIRIIYLDFTLLQNGGLFFMSLIVMSLIWEGMRGIHVLLNKYYPFEKDVTRRIILQIVIATVYLLSVRFIFLSLFIDTAQNAFPGLALKLIYFADIILGISINLGFIASYFFSKWKESLVTTERLEKEKALVQFNNLKNQLNPHFLFNSLTSLNSLIMDDQAKASVFLQQLSKVYRYVLQSRNSTLIPLSQELEFIRHYISLMKTRFAEGFSVEICPEVHALPHSIVPVTLQILIENALKHNAISATDPLCIKIYKEGDYLVVENPKSPKKIVESSEKVGLANLRNLYEFIGDKPLIISEEAGTFTVKIPLQA